jgi:hypothetical protein
MHGGDGNAYTILVGKPERKRQVVTDERLISK